MSYNEAYVNPRDFLADRELRPFQFKLVTDVEPVGVVFGREPHPLEVVIAKRERRPSYGTMDAAWHDYRDNRDAPILLVVLFQKPQCEASVMGLWRNSILACQDMDPQKVSHLLQGALEIPNGHAGLAFFLDTLYVFDLL